MKFVANKTCAIYTGMHCDRWYCHEIKSQLVFVGLCPVPLGLVAMALPVSRPPWPGPHGTACVPMQIHPMYTCPDMKYEISLRMK